MEALELAKAMRGLSAAKASGMIKMNTSGQAPDAHVVTEKISAKEKAKRFHKNAYQKKVRNRGRLPSPATCIREYTGKKGNYFRVVIRRGESPEYRSANFLSLTEAIKDRDKKIEEMENMK
jgi:hypothetical protein